MFTFVAYFLYVYQKKDVAANLLTQKIGKKGWPQVLFLRQINAARYETIYHDF